MQMTAREIRQELKNLDAHIAGFLERCVPQSRQQEQHLAILDRWMTATFLMAEVLLASTNDYYPLVNAGIIAERGREEAERMAGNGAESKLFSPKAG